MNKQIITFKADEQNLVKTGGTNCYASNIVSYIEAHFDLGENWSGYDSVRAVWSNDNNMTVISTVLDSDGVCVVPFEVLKTKGTVMVNLVGSISASDVLTDRLTTFPCEAVKVARKAKINGSETTPITPSQFEQYIAIVRSLVDSVKDIDHIELNSDYTLTIYYSDGTSDTTTSIRGADGNGIASVTKTGTSGLVDTYTITFTDGNTTTFTVTNGAKGETGNGIQSIAKTSTVGLVDTYTITYTDGTTTTFTVTNGEKGDKGDTGEVSYADLSSLLPTDTASGAIASFPDGQSVIPALSVLCDIEPIQSGSGTPSPDNVRPISGHTECEVTRTGKNLLPTPTLPTVYYWGTDILNSLSVLNALPIGTYTISMKFKVVTIPTNGKVQHGRPYLTAMVNGSQVPVLSYSVATDNSPSVGKVYTETGTFTITEENKGKFNHAYLYCDQADAHSGSDRGAFEPFDIQLELSSTASDYEPYNGTSYTTSLGRTVYGGEVEIVGGSLTDKMGMTTVGALNWTKGNRNDDDTGYIFRTPLTGLMNTQVLSSAYSTVITPSRWEQLHLGEICRPTSYLCICADYETASEFKTANADVQICYELAQPQTYQLTPTDIALLEGQNNVWCDCGEVEVTYKADVGLYINKKLNV